MEISRSRVKRPGANGNTTSNGTGGKFEENHDEVFGLLENAPTNILFCDLDFVIQYVNPKSVETLATVEKLLPVRASAVLGQSIDIFHKNPAHQRKILGDDRNLPIRTIIHLGPEKLDLLVSAIYDGSGNYKGAMVTWEIVTEKLKMKEENIEFQGISEALSRSQAQIEFNTDGIIQSANENFLSTLGYKLEEIKGKHHSIFCDEDYAKSPEYKMFWSGLNSGQFSSGQYMRIAKDGTHKWIQATYNPVMQDGKVIKVVKYAVDITESKTKELERSAIMARVNSMMENMPLNVMMCDLEEFKITYMNPKSLHTLRGLENLLAVSADKVVGSSIDIFHKSPERQRKLLSSERNLPYSTKIKLGEHILKLDVSAILDEHKTYIGPMVTWDVITETEAVLSTLEETSEQLSAAAEELSATATQMAKNAGQTSDQSVSASAAAEEVSKGVETVATNTEEMAASIKEISKSSSEAAEISKDALHKATETNTIITQLGDASQEIGNVIKVISSIAQQTNLLALNATIEAARAGDAGKGFAVVANEVKELARQTAKATEDITQRIGNIQESSKTSVDAIGSISTVIEKLNGIAMTIAAAVEEQSATTNEVSRVVQESKQGVTGIADTVKIVAEAAGQSSTGANQTLEAANGLNKLAQSLKDLVERVKGRK